MKLRSRRCCYLSAVGIALDGDADRVVMVDEYGHLIEGDQLLAVIAESWREDGRLAHWAGTISFHGNA